MSFNFVASFTILSEIWHFPFFPHLFAMKWWDQMPWSFILNVKLSQLFHSPFTFTKRLFSCSSLPAIRVVPSAYLRLLMFLLAVLIPACESNSTVFHVCSAYKLKKQDDSTPFPICNQSIVPSSVLTVASCPAYGFLRKQVRWFGIPIFSRIFHSLFWSTQSKALAQSVK